MGIIQLVLADWPVSIIKTASVLVKRKLYTCTYSYMIRDGFKTLPPVDRRFCPVPPGLYCSKQWQPPGTGRNRRSTGGWVLKPPLSIFCFPVRQSLHYNKFFKMLFMPPWPFLLQNSCSYQPDGTKISLIHHMGRWNGTVWAWFELKTLYIVHLQV